jgi:hypothetical protein
MIPHLFGCQGLALDDYSFAIARLGSRASSTVAHWGNRFMGRESNTVSPRDCEAAFTSFLKMHSVRIPRTDF